MERLTTMRDGRPAFAQGYKERFTEHSLFFMLLNRLAAYEDAMPIERARELAQAEKDGRLVVLPFRVGVPLYEVTGKGVREHQVEQFSISKEDLFIQTLDKDIWYRGGRIFGPEQIGKTVFLTREEAEAALKKREEDNETETD